MNAPLAASIAAVATTVFWAIAADAAGHRRMTIGTMPVVLPVLAGAAACAAAIAGLPAPTVMASAGAVVAGVVDARTGSIFDPLTAAMLLCALALAAFD